MNTKLGIGLKLDTCDGDDVAIELALAGKPRFIHSFDRKLEIRQILEAYPDKVVYSRKRGESAGSNGTGSRNPHTEVVLQLDTELFARLSYGEWEIISSSDAATETVFEDWSRRFPKSDDTKAFYVINTVQRQASTDRVSLKEFEPLDDTLLPVLYGEDITGWVETLEQSLQNRHTGLSLLEGPPGTGKSTFIRNLISRWNAQYRFLFVPPNGFSFLAQSDMVSFWMQQKEEDDRPMIVILEDCGSLICRRESDNEKAVSNLLNITDGLLGDFLQLHVICTINEQPEELDPALLRPGRLVAHRHFGLLDAEATAAACRALGRDLPDGWPRGNFSLAEIFGEKITLPQNRPGVGFGASS